MRPAFRGQARATELVKKCHAKQPVVKVWLHSTSDASPPAALLLLQILPVFSVVAPCRRGASLVSVRRQTFTTGCQGRFAVPAAATVTRRFEAKLHYSPIPIFSLYA